MLLITFSLSILSKLADTEIPLMRDQIFSTVHTSDLLLSSQYLKPKGFQSQESDTQNTWKLLQDVMYFSITFGCVHLWAEAASPLYLSNHLWGKILFFACGMCCSLCSAAAGDYTYLQHPARCRQTQSQSPLTQEMLFLPSSSGTPSLWHLAHLLPWCWSPFAHNPLVHLDLVFNPLVPLYSCNPTLGSSGFFHLLLFLQTSRQNRPDPGLCK